MPQARYNEPRANIAHYRIVSKIGEGGMGAVYRVTDTKLNRDVAIKVLAEVFAEAADGMARFAREEHRLLTGRKQGESCSQLVLIALMSAC